MKKNNSESAAYIVAMSKQLAELARQNEFMDAARLLQMVHLEITQYCEDPPRHAQGNNSARPTLTMRRAWRPVINAVASL